MELRIKILYSITIVAILAFLGMQTYWLYGQYEYSLKQSEEEAYVTLLSVIKDYDAMRSKSDSTMNGMTVQSEYNIDLGVKDGRATRTATITRRKYFAHRVLGISDDRKLTPEESRLAANMVIENEGLGIVDKKSFDASSAPSEVAIWSGFKNMDLEFNAPFDITTLDSLFTLAGLDTSLSLVLTDSIVWDASITAHASALHPKSVISIPYSELERKSLIVECRYSVASVLGNMTGSLVIVAVLSLFLIVCLILQISTVLKLSRLDRMRSSFVTTMIHELKRPISTLKMCVSGIENERMMADRDIRRELTAETRGALDNLSSYFSKLRDITFNNVEQIPLNIVTVDLRTLFDTAARSIAIPGDKTVSIINDIDSGTEISADQSHMLNILNNLVENAVKYSGESVVIIATARVEHDDVVISISDNGKGIPASDIKHIFHRFYRGKTDTDQPGMGLGLTYVKLLVDAHGGTITVKSTEGKGTCFTITLPQ